MVIPNFGVYVLEQYLIWLPNKDEILCGNK